MPKRFHARSAESVAQRDGSCLTPLTQMGQVARGIVLLSRAREQARRLKFGRNVRAGDTRRGK